MKSNINTKRLNNLLNGIQRSIELFQSQGYTDVYFTAQFLKSGRKQNGIERGDIETFSTQIRTYVKSEDADSVKLDFVDCNSGKCIYSKSLHNLKASEIVQDPQRPTTNTPGLAGFNGLGEAEFNKLVDQRVEVKERHNEFIRIGKENEELRSRNEALMAENEELDATLKAKKETEYYMGIIGTVFPGLAPLFQGTALANTATFLAGTTDLHGQALSQSSENTNNEARSVGAMVSEFCNTLSVQEAGVVYLLFTAFEKDRTQIQRALQFISQTPATTS